MNFGENSSGISVIQDLLVIFVHVLYIRHKGGNLTIKGGGRGIFIFDLGFTETIKNAIKRYPLVILTEGKQCSGSGIGDGINSSCKVSFPLNNSSLFTSRRVIRNY